MPELRKRHARSATTQLGCAVVMLCLFGFTALCTGVFNLANFLLNPVGFVAAGLLATACTLPYSLLLHRIDRHEPEPLLMLLVAFCWGAVGSVGLSLIGNTLFGVITALLTADAQLSQTLTAVVSAPIVEESTKALGLVALYIFAKDELDNVVDGILYGAMIGLGFAWAENIHYYLQVSAQGAGAMLSLTLMRGVFHGLAGHATFTGLTGAAVGVFRVQRSGGLRWFAPPVGLALAMVAHGAWNLFAPWLMTLFEDPTIATILGVPLAVVLFSVPFGLLLGAALLLSWREEELVIRTFLADEACVMPDDLEALLPSGRRAGSMLQVWREQGWTAARARRRRNHALVELAFARWHHASDPRCDWAVDEDADVVACRITLSS